MSKWLFLLALLNGCIHPASSKPVALNAEWVPDAPVEMVVLVDEQSPIYAHVMIGIQVALKGAYRVFQVGDDGISQNRLLEEVIRLSPRGLIALGPRAAHAVSQAKIFVPSAFALVPRPKNYILENAFSYGVRMVPDSWEQMGLVRSIASHLKRIGVMYSRLHSKSILQSLQDAKDEAVELVAIEIQSESDVMPALRRHRGDFDGFLMIEDPLLLHVAVTKDMIAFFRQEKIPFFALDCSMVREGALAAFGVNYASLGLDLVDLVLKTKGIGVAQETKLKNPNQASICINLETAKSMWSIGDFLSVTAREAALKGRTVVYY